MLDGGGEAEYAHDDGGGGQLAEQDGVDLPDEPGPDDLVVEGLAEVGGDVGLHVGAHLDVKTHLSDESVLLEWFAVITG